MSQELIQHRILSRALKEFLGLYSLPDSEKDWLIMYREAFFMACHELSKIKINGEMKCTTNII